MKKVIILLVMVFAAPVMAMVVFSAEDNGDGTITISYTTEGEKPAGIALNLLGDGVTINSVVSWGCGENGYNVCPDYAFDNSENYEVGDEDQTPIADPAGPGVGTLPATEVSVCVGYLDEDGDEILGEPGPDACADLITLQVSGIGNITVSADTLRGPDSGVVGSGGSELASNLPLCFGPPPPCRGDLNDDDWIKSDDISLLVNYWLDNKDIFKRAPLYLPGYIEGMDINGDGWIKSDDISDIVNWWLDNKDIFKRAPCMPAT